MGNLSARRDWGHAKDYIQAMYLMLQQDEPDDYVIATGITTEVREFIKRAFEFTGISLVFTGEKENETGIISGLDENLFIKRVGEEFIGNFKLRIKKDPEVVKVDPAYFRPTEVDLLIGDPSKAKSKLGWKPEYDLDKLIEDMISSDLRLMKKEDYLREGGYEILNYFE